MTEDTMSEPQDTTGGLSGAEEMRPGQFRKKPVVIEAMQFRGPQLTDVDYMVLFDDWLSTHQGDFSCKYRGNTLVIPTLEGDMVAQPGDWIIRGVKGEIYPCKPDIFAATYEPALPLPAKQPQDDRGTEELARLRGSLAAANEAVEWRARTIKERDQQISELKASDEKHFEAMMAAEDRVRELEAALRSDRAANKARIGEAATAPKDGTPFLAWCSIKPGLGDTDATPDGEWRVVWWEARGQFTSDRDLGNEVFTGWLPLPASLPAIKQESGNG